jgi:hypothetical protein
MQPPSVPPIRRNALLTPTLAELKADAALSAQAEQLTEEIQFSTAGIDFSKHYKRGYFRSGGDIAPIRRVPWPQDFVLGGGELLRS